MLVLSRKPGETIQIGDSITVTVVRIGPGSVRIGIEAPPHLNIARGELIQVFAGFESVDVGNEIQPALVEEDL